MHKLIELKVHEKHLEKYKNQYPLLFKEAFIGSHLLENDSIEEGSIIRLVDERNHYVATGYYGKQNKGFGWILSRKDKERFNKEFFQKKLYQSIQKRIGLFNNPKTTAFRVFNGEGDGIGGLTIDFYDGYYLINWYSKGIYTFKDDIVAALSQIVEYDAIYEKKRFDDNIEDTDDGFIMGTPTTFPIIIKENGINLNIFFNEGAMVGVFLDQREVRRTIRNNYSKGKIILNAFSYTGAFSVFAALGGARKTVSVDLANRSYEHTLNNFKSNDLELGEHEIVVEDVFHYFKFAQKKDISYDMIILDPPSFAKSKDFTFSAERDYPELLSEAISITRNHGIIVASNNSSTISLEKFQQLIGKGFNLANARFEIVETHQLPKDFKTNHYFDESNYLKVIFIRVLKKK